MRVKFVRFSRPLFMRAGNEKNNYYTAYGFRLIEGEEDSPLLDYYVGYVAAISDWSNGGDLFEAPAGPMGDLIDRSGEPIPLSSPWAKNIFNQCKEKFKLKYTIQEAEISGEDFKTFFNLDNVLIDKNFYYKFDAVS